MTSEESAGVPVLMSPWGNDATIILAYVDECRLLFEGLGDQEKQRFNAISEEIALIAATALGLGDEFISASEEEQVEFLRRKLVRVTGLQ
jgi:hypothetical protein